MHKKSTACQATFTIKNLASRLKYFFRREHLLCLFSATLLICSYPKNNFWILAWIAFIPLLIALEGKPARESFRLGYLLGLMFFAGMLYWFVFVTAIGMILLILFLSMYFGCFGLAYCWAQKKNVVLQLLFIPACWAALEFIRSHFLTGFGWVLLGHSQEKNLWVIQIADITGVYGVSFFVMMVNVALTQIILSWLRGKVFFLKRYRQVGAMTLFVLVFVLVYGFYRLHQPMHFTKPSVRLGIIQASITNERRRHPQQWPVILQEHIQLASLAAREHPDLIIWPESSFPGHHWQRPDLFAQLTQSIQQIKTPSLIGLVTKDDEHYFNAAFLFSQKGKIRSRYHKMILVPFGEYIPLREVFPFLSWIVPIDDFTPGKEYVLVPIRQNDREIFLGVLICFEDTLPQMAREFSRRGADLLVNMTNDDWFGDTKAPFLHRQAALFRAVENRKPLVRSANTGVSCFIDSRGRILSSIADSKGKKTYIQGFLTQETYIADQETFYTKYGDLFTYLCFGGILIETARVFIHKKKKKIKA